MLHSLLHFLDNHWTFCFDRTNYERHDRTSSFLLDGIALFLLTNRKIFSLYLFVWWNTKTGSNPPAHILFSTCQPFNSFIPFSHLLGSFIFCFPIIFSVLCTHSWIYRMKLDSIRFCLWSFVIYTVARVHCMHACVRVKVVRAHAAISGNKSHKWKYSRKVGINGLNEFSRVKRTERENERSFEIVHGNIQSFLCNQTYSSVWMLCEL